MSHQTIIKPLTDFNTHISIEETNVKALNRTFGWSNFGATWIIVKHMQLSFSKLESSTFSGNLHVPSTFHWALIVQRRF